MGDPYWRYGSAADREGVPRTSFPGYLSSDTSSLASHRLWNSNDFRGSSSEYLQNDILPRPGSYGLDHLTGTNSRVTPGFGGLSTGASIVPPLEDPALISQRRDIALGISPGIPDILNERPNSLRKSEGLQGEESNILFVDGLPNDCTRREVAHLFRPFIGFKEIRVVHKEPRRSGDKAMVLCFVEFDDAKCALTALEALQGYKFDDKKPDSPDLRIQFARFPFRSLTDREDRRLGVPR
ncbi:PREDICTED: RNA-binding protein 1-like [Nelumbo nucifera]|uniref:RRM domain-containing protein n=2 Tax=Nelumbo nucifera TaxID=4432 RepID=A0A823A5G3_NELNU|nr:PREDICTED: RNA-binding protein 1-like [Nelumbo nucifera]DAD49048.1 TPA_asm: hypothetical protein HUJ06_018985 [Nelumbo nucifera]